MSLKELAQAIRNETQPGANAPRVGELFVGIVDAINDSADFFPPYLSSAAVTTEVTSDSITYNFTKAVDAATPQIGLKYMLYRGDFDALDDVDLIESQFKADEAFDVDSFTLTNLVEAELVNARIIVEDEAGNKSFYDTVSEVTLEATDPPQQAPSILVDQVEEDSLGIDVAHTDLTFENPATSGYKLEVIRKTGTELTDTLEGDRVVFADLSWTHSQGDELEIRIYGYNENGDGPKSNPLGWTTNTYGSVTATTTLTTA